MIDSARQPSHADQNQEPAEAKEVGRADQTQIDDLLDAVPLVLFSLAADGRIIRLNSAFERLSGHRVDAWIGRHFSELIESNDQDRAMSAFRQMVRTGDVTDLEFHIIAADGRRVTLEASGRPHVKHGQVIGISGYARDVTEQRRAEQQIDYQLLLLGTVSDAIISTDLNSVIQSWNHAAETIYGWRSDEVIGQSIGQLLNTRFLEGDGGQAFEHLLQTGTWSGEVIQRHRSGAEVRLLSSVSLIRNSRGEPLGAVAVNRDITAEVRARTAATNVEKLYRQAILATGGVAYQRDHACNTYSFLGEGFEALSGYSADEMDVSFLASRVRRYESYGEHAHLTHAERVHMAQTSPGFVWHTDILFERKDGSLVWISDHAVQVLDDAGNITSSLGILTDISERKRAEEERAALQAHLAQVQRMEMVGQLAGCVAHDYNNMLAVILMRTEMALQQLDPASPLYRHLSEIYKMAQRSAELTRQLLGFARRQPIAPRVLDLNTTIDGMLSMVKHLIGENIELIWKPSQKETLVSMDPAQIDQILVNLCVNARDAIDGAGAIVLTTETVSLDARTAMQHNLSGAGDYALVTVSDNGSGMGKDVSERIFEPFFTTKAVGRGTGLGLATVYGIVQQNQGAIGVVSQLGMGTTFRVYLPAIRDNVMALPASENTLPPTRGNGETILLVEDEAAVLEMGSEGLSHLGYRVLAAHTPEEALALYGHHAGAIDLLLTDVVMAQMSGYELAQRLHQHKPTLPVLYMSGYPAEIIVRRGVLYEGAHLWRRR